MSRGLGGGLDCPRERSDFRDTVAEGKGSVPGDEQQCPHLQRGMVCPLPAPTVDLSMAV